MKSFSNILALSYFGKLYQKDKLVFTIASLFIFLSVFANIIRLETSPFFLWNLYAEKQSPAKEYTIFEIRYNNGEVLNFQHTWLSPQQQLLTTPLFHYAYVKTNGGKDPLQSYLENFWVKKHPFFKPVVYPLYNHASQYYAFPEWYKKYLSSVKKQPIRQVYLLKKKLSFLENGRVQEISSDTALFIR